MSAEHIQIYKDTIKALEDDNEILSEKVTQLSDYLEGLANSTDTLLEKPHKLITVEEEIRELLKRAGA